MSVCASVARSTTPSTCAISAWTCSASCRSSRQIVTEDLDRDVRASAGEHVIDAVRNRLANRDVRAGQQRDLLSQLLEHRLARPIAI